MNTANLGEWRNDPTAVWLCISGCPTLRGGMRRVRIRLVPNRALISNTRDGAPAVYRKIAHSR